MAVRVRWWSGGMDTSGGSTADDVYLVVDRSVGALRIQAQLPVRSRGESASKIIEGIADGLAEDVRPDLCAFAAEDSHLGGDRG